MSTRKLVWTAALAGFVLFIAAIGEAKADRRVALVVGNSNYANPSLFLANPKNDADDVAAALRGVGFEVLHVTNANKRELDLNMAKFARLATDADAALFYYAGHAVQFQGRNFLMPADAEVEDEISFRYQMTPLDDVRAALDRGDGVKIVILDACRNNPVVNALRRKKTNGSRSVDSVRGGLAKIDKAQGMVVAYSTAADEVAADGDGRNSPFTSAFLKRLKEPGLEIEQLFRRVAADVNASTGGRQRPETYVSLLSNYYLNQTDRVAFDKIKDLPDPTVLQDFIARFPTSSYIGEAQARIQHIELAIRDRQLQQARAQEAARLAEEQKRSEREAALRKQAEQEVALRKQEDARAKLAAEKERQSREAAQEEQRAKFTAEQARKDREAKSQEEARAKLAAEQARLAREAQIQEEVRVKIAAERDRREREAVQRVLEEQQRTKVAGRQEPAGPALSGLSAETRTAPPVQGAPTAADACERDGAVLARLRSNPSRDKLAELERSLGCEKLRPQISRLQESLQVANAAPVVPSQSVREPVVVEKPAPPPVPVVAAPPAPVHPASPKPPEQLANAAPVVAIDQVQACRQAEARLSKIRATPVLADLLALEREPGCERLRPQMVRLRESLTKSDQTIAASPSEAPAAPANRPVEAQPQSPPPKPLAASAQLPSCERDRATLARLRASQSREELVRFERELGCEQLRPQLLRLKESLPGG